MRYLLGPQEERRFLLELVDRYDLTPIEPDGAEALKGVLDARPSPVAQNRRLEPRPTIILWAAGIGPLRRLSERVEETDPKARVMMALNQNPNAIDLERTPVLTWSRPVWHSEVRRWIIPSRFATTPVPLKQLDPELHRLFRRIEATLRKNGRRVNSWDLPGSEGDDTLAFTRPRNTRAYHVTVWPEAEAWLERGLRLYHWDS